LRVDYLQKELQNGTKVIVRHGVDSVLWMMNLGKKNKQTNKQT